MLNKLDFSCRTYSLTNTPKT